MTTNNILKAIHGAVKAGLGLAVCFGIATLFGGCKDTVSSKPCACPSGKIHSTAPCDCGADINNCHCNLFDLGHGKVLEDKTGLLTQGNLDMAKGIVDTNFSAYPTFSQFTKIIVESGDHPPMAPFGTGDNGVITIKIGSFSSPINLGSAISSGYASAVAYMMDNSNIRLANAQPVITPRAQVAWAHKGARRHFCLTDAPAPDTVS
jgi:hypothetical protein